jgi:hypothetical protein
MTNGIAKQWTMQIVESAIATRSTYFESNIRAEAGSVRSGRRAYRSFAPGRLFSGGCGTPALLSAPAYTPVIRGAAWSFAARPF